MGGPELPPAAVAAAGHHGHAQHPATSKARVITTTKAITDAHEAKKEYGPSAAIKAGRGAKVLIEDYTPQAEVVYRVMESGMSLGSTVMVLNQWC